MISSFCTFYDTTKSRLQKKFLFFFELTKHISKNCFQQLTSICFVQKIWKLKQANQPPTNHLFNVFFEIGFWQVCAIWRLLLEKLPTLHVIKKFSFLMPHTAHFAHTLITVNRSYCFTIKSAVPTCLTL